MAIEQLERPRVADASTITAPSRQESAPTTLAESGVIAHTARIGLLVALGYEWLVSGLDKILYGRFPEALGGLLASVLRAGNIPAPFAALLRALALPQAVFFGWLIEWSETLAGLALLSAALMALLRPILERRLAPEARSWLARGSSTVDALAVAAAVGTVLLGLSFYLLDGAPAFWPLPSVAFGGAVDTGLLLAALAAPLALGPALRWLRDSAKSINVRIRRRSASPYSFYSFLGNGTLRYVVGMSPLPLSFGATHPRRRLRAGPREGNRCRAWRRGAVQALRSSRQWRQTRLGPDAPGQGTSRPA